MSLGIFSVVPPTEPCALRSTQPLKVSTRDFYWGKGGRCLWLTTCHPWSAETSRKSGALSYPEPLGPLQPVGGDIYFTLLIWVPDWCKLSWPIDGELSKTLWLYGDSLNPWNLNPSTLHFYVKFRPVMIMYYIIYNLYILCSTLLIYSRFLPT